MTSEPEAAVAIVHARLQDSILLIRRAERVGDPWSGHWSFPGGHRDPEDPDLLRTALRELEEECGVQLSPQNVDAALPSTLARRKAGRFLTVAPFVFRVDCELPVVLDRREAVGSLWIPLPALLDPARHCIRPVPGMPEQLYFPAVDLQAMPLWGFTYRVISDWLGLDPQQRPIEQAGFEVACRLLDFVLTHGLKLEHEWTERPAFEDSFEPRMVKVADVKGVIPVTSVIAHFSMPGRHVPAVNCLEVRPDRIRLVGPAFEEYVISASA